jgi:hypothetical protein
MSMPELKRFLRALDEAGELPAVEERLASR